MPDMFSVENVKKLFPLLDEIEKDHSCFGRTEKQALYRIAFYKEDFGEVQRILMQAAAPHLTEKERGQILSAHEESLPKPPGMEAAQIENYIFQMQHMIYEKEKANRMLEEVLKQRGLEKELDTLTGEAKKRPAGEQNRGTVRNGKAI